MKLTTPGPWIVRGGNVIESLSRVYVAKAWMTDGEEECANARLIASSPTLLSALQGVVDAYGCECLDTEPQPHCPMCIARAAIAKAKGRKGK